MKVKDLRRLNPATIESESARIAFWLNVYNARLRHALWERRSSGHLLRHRRMFRNATYELAGLRYSLDQIEHGLLRGNRRPPFALRRTLPADDPRLGAAPPHPDPRIHFALNCGAVSCPPVRSYSAAGLDAELEAATSAYIAAESELDETEGLLRLPGLMRLYRADFEDLGGVAAYALRYLAPETEAAALDVSFAPFDWSLQSEDLSAK